MSAQVGDRVGAVLKASIGSRTVVSVDIEGEVFP